MPTASAGSHNRESPSPQSLGGHWRGVYLREQNADRNARILALRFLDGWKLAEIAAIFSLHLTTIWRVCQDHAEANGFTDPDKFKVKQQVIIRGRKLTKTSTPKKFSLGFKSTSPLRKVVRSDSQNSGFFTADIRSLYGEMPQGREIARIRWRWKPRIHFER